MSAVRFLHRHRVGILTVHGVMDERPAQAWRPSRSFLAPSQLQHYVRLLQEAYDFIPLTEAVEMLGGQRAPRKNCLVMTFDDGYLNNATEAWPVLQSCGVPATFFVVTARVARPEPFWFDRLDYAFQHLPQQLDHVPVGHGCERHELPVEDRETQLRSCRALRSQCKSLSPDDIERIVCQIESAATSVLTDVFSTDAWTALMTVENVKSLAREGADIGSHTRDHTILDIAPDEAASLQLTESKRAIESWIENRCDHVCYPSGRTNTRTASLANDAGYKCAVTTSEGANRIGDDLHMLRRVNLPPNLSDSEVMARVCGATQTLSRWKQRIRG